MVKEEFFEKYKEFIEDIIKRNKSDLKSLEKYIEIINILSVDSSEKQNLKETIDEYKAIQIEENKLLEKYITDFEKLIGLLKTDAEFKNRIRKQAEDLIAKSNKSAKEQIVEK